MRTQVSPLRIRLMALAAACVLAACVGTMPAYANEADGQGDATPENAVLASAEQGQEAQSPTGAQDGEAPEAPGTADGTGTADVNKAPEAAAQDQVADEEAANADEQPAATESEAADDEAAAAGDEADVTGADVTGADVTGADAGNASAAQDPSGAEPAESDPVAAATQDAEAAQGAEAAQEVEGAAPAQAGSTAPAADADTARDAARAASSAPKEASSSNEPATQQAATEPKTASAAKAPTAQQAAAPKVDAQAGADAGKGTQGANSTKWSATALSMDAGDGKLGATVVLAPKMTGNTTDLAFRYTIETDDGKDVTLLRRFKRGIPEFTFTLNRSGKVSIKLEVSDYKGNKKVLTRHLTVAVPAWSMTKLSPDYLDGGATAFVPNLTGDTRFLRYRYTWTAADGTTKNGTIAADGEQSAAFKPANGVYDIALHVIGTDGKARDAKLSYVQGATRATFNFDLSNTLVHSGKSVTAKASGTDEKGRALSFAYALGTAKGTGASATLATPADGGFYPLNTKISSGGKQIATRTDTITAWNLVRLKAKKSGRTINLKAIRGGIPHNWTYKFTYSGPAGSGVIQDGRQRTTSYNAPQGGAYQMTVELFDENGKRMDTKTAKVNVPLDLSEIMLQEAQGYSSATSKLILVNTDERYVGVYSGSRGNWQTEMFTEVSVGAPSTPTVKGTFTVGSKGYSFSGDVYTCYYWTQFYGDYLFHSVLYKRGTYNVYDPRRGYAISHGCVRMHIDDARWLQNNVPSGSKVVVY